MKFSVDTSEQSFLCQASVWIIITNVCRSYFNCPCRTKYSPLQDLSIFTPVARQKFLCLMISVRIIITNVSLSRVICITCVARHKFETFYETISFHMCIVHAVEWVNLSVNYLISHMSLKFGANPLCCFCDRQILQFKMWNEMFFISIESGISKTTYSSTSAKCLIPNQFLICLKDI